MKLFISHSLNKDFAELLHNTVKARLADKNVVVWIDAKSLNTGVKWRTEIYQSLYSCDAAVLLFNADARKSPWVLFEASILCWRNALHGSPHVLPISFLQPGETIPKEDWGPFSPCQLREIQIEKRDDIDLPSKAASKQEIIQDYQESIRLLTDLIVDFVKDVKEVQGDTLNEIWSGRIREMVKNVDLIILRTAVKDLTYASKNFELDDIPDNELVNTFPKLVLHSDVTSALKAYIELTQSTEFKESDFLKTIEPIRISPLGSELYLRCCKTPEKSHRNCIIEYDTALSESVPMTSDCFRHRSFGFGKKSEPIQSGTGVFGENPEEMHETALHNLKTKFNCQSINALKDKCGDEEIHDFWQYLIVTTFPPIDLVPAEEVLTEVKKFFSFLSEICPAIPRIIFVPAGTLKEPEDNSFVLIKAHESGETDCITKFHDLSP